MIEKFETELRDDSEFTNWQTKMKAQDDEVGLYNVNPVLSRSLKASYFVSSTICTACV
jgi:hypothetical protein